MRANNLMSVTNIDLVRNIYKRCQCAYYLMHFCNVVLRKFHQQSVRHIFPIVTIKPARQEQNIENKEDSNTHLPKPLPPYGIIGIIIGIMP